MLPTIRVMSLGLVLVTQCLQGAVSSKYTEILQKTLNRWPLAPIAMAELEGKAVQIKVFETPGNIDYIGSEFEMGIDAPLAAVEAVLDGVENYIELLPGFKEIKKTEIDKDHFEIFWEKIIPVFFVKNVKYTISYTVDRSKPDRRVYVGQLKEKKSLASLDSLLVIEKRGEKTHYFETAFFDGDFGVITTLAPMKIWRESIEAVLHGALAKKAKAEKPDIKYDELMAQVAAEVKTYPVEALVEKRKPHPDLSSVSPSPSPTK